MNRRTFLAAIPAVLAWFGIPQAERWPLGQVQWKPTAKQLEFLNDPRPRVLYTTGYRDKACYHPLTAKRWAELKAGDWHVG